MTESEAKAWIGRVCAERAQPEPRATSLPDPTRKTSDNAAALRLWRKWREEDAKLPADYVPDFDPEDLPPVRFRTLREMGLPEDGWD